MDDGSEVIKTLATVVDDLLGEALAAQRVGERQVRTLRGQVDAPATVDAGRLAPADVECVGDVGRVRRDRRRHRRGQGGTPSPHRAPPAPAPAPVLRLGPGHRVGGDAHHHEQHDDDHDEQRPLRALLLFDPGVFLVRAAAAAGSGSGASVARPPRNWSIRPGTGSFLRVAWRLASALARFASALAAALSSDWRIFASVAARFASSASCFFVSAAYSLGLGGVALRRLRRFLLRRCGFAFGCDGLCLLVALAFLLVQARRLVHLLAPLQDLALALLLGLGVPLGQGRRPTTPGCGARQRARQRRRPAATAPCPGPASSAGVIIVRHVRCELNSAAIRSSASSTVGIHLVGHIEGDRLVQVVFERELELVLAPLSSASRTRRPRRRSRPGGPPRTRRRR